MKHWTLILPLLFSAAAAIAAEPTPAPFAPEKAVKSMLLPDGFRATVFAAEPDVVQPISFCTDARGRLFVAEALNYGTWKATGKDRIVILEDSKGDGKADKRTVFYEGFNYITGIEVGFGGVWVMSPPKLYFIPFREGDDKPSGAPEVIFDGFGYKESRHNLANGFTWGPDGWLYGNHGVFKLLKQRDAPTASVFEIFADGTTNPWGVDFDDFGQCFVSNCVNPHLFHMIQGGHYEPWRNRSSSLYAYDRLPTIADHLHYPGGDLKAQLGSPNTLAMGGGHAHCGTLIYLGDRFPASYRNTVFMCNVHGRRINNDILKRKGSGYTAAHGKDFMMAGDPWFMGVTLRTGPDGSLFVSDWSDTGECHTLKPNVTTGRIYKITFGAADRTAVDLTKLSDAELVKLQLHRNDWHVRTARRLLQERTLKPDWKAEPTHAALTAMLDSKELGTPERLRALWALHVTGGLSAERLLDLLNSPSLRVGLGENLNSPSLRVGLGGNSNGYLRAWAIQLLCEDSKPSAKAIGKFAEMARSDPSPVVRLYLAAALQRLPLPERWAIAEGLLSHAEDADDANLPLMEWYGIEALVPADPDKALQLAAKARMPLVRQYIARRVVEDAVARGEKGDLGALVTVLTAADAKVQLDLLKGAREGLRGRKSMKMPENWPAAYTRLTRSDDEQVREHAIVLALIFGDPQAIADLRKTALTTADLPAKRHAALEALIDKRIEGLAPMLQDLLTDKAIRRTALRGLASLPHDATPAKVLALYKEMSAEEKQDAIATLASRKEYALELLKAIEKKDVARTDVSAYIARQLYSIGDKQLTDRLHLVWGDVRSSGPQKLEQMTRYKKMLTPNFVKSADLSNGRLIFSKSCQNCHKLYGEGGTIGPDITGSNRADLDYLLSNLIDPSAEVAKDYRMSIVETQNGRKISGIVVERTPARLIIQTATERIILAVEDVDTVRDSDISIMPDGQLDVLTKEQIRDLIGYLAAKGQVALPGGGKEKR